MMFEELTAVTKRILLNTEMILIEIYLQRTVEDLFERRIEIHVWYVMCRVLEWRIKL